MTDKPRRPNERPARTLSSSAMRPIRSATSQSRWGGRQSRQRSGRRGCAGCEPDLPPSGKPRAWRAHPCGHEIVCPSRPRADAFRGSRLGDAHRVFDSGEGLLGRRHTVRACRHLSVALTCACKGRVRSAFRLRRISRAYRSGRMRSTRRCPCRWLRPQSNIPPSSMGCL